MSKPHWMFKLIFGCSVLFSAGILSTRLSVGDGLAQLQGRAAAVAVQALSAARGVCLNSPLEYLLIPRVQVVYVKEFGGHHAAVVGGKARHYEVLLRTYTLFGLLLGTIRVGSDGRIRCDA